MHRRSAALLVCALFGASWGASSNDLLDYYHLAQEHDPTYRAALDQRDAAIEALPQADAALLPILTTQEVYSNTRLHVLSSREPLFSSLNGSSGNPAPAAEEVTTYYSSHSYSLSINQTLFDWSAFQTLSKAHILVLEADAALHDAEQSLIYRTADAYFTVLLAQDTLNADLSAQSAYKRQTLEAQHKYDIGYVPVTDLKNASAAYDTASAAVIADQRALDSAKRALQQIVGRRVDKIAPVADEIPLKRPTPDSEEDWVESSLKENPTLLTAFYTAQAARKDVMIARGKYLPTVAASGAWGRQVSHSEFGDDAIQDAVGVTLNWNYSLGGGTQSVVRQMRATAAAQEEAFEGQKRLTERGARDAYEAEITGVDSIKASKQAVESNQVSVIANEAGLKIGIRTEVDVLTAQQNLDLAQRNYASARYDFLRSMLVLKQQAGDLLERDLAVVDGMLQSGGGTAQAPEAASAARP